MLKKKINLAIPLLFLWPFGAFLLTLRSIPSRISGIIYVIFTTLFGYAFSFTTISADSYRVAWVFGSTKNTILYTFEKYTSGLITDLYKYLVYSVTEIFTNNPKVVFAIFGFIFGIFSYKSLQLLLDIDKRHRDVFVFIIALVFFASNPIININGARFYTAAIIALCAIISLMFYDRKIWLIPLVSTVFFHFSFLFIVPIVVLIYFFKRYLFSSARIQKLIFIVFCFIFLLSFLSSSNILNLEFLTEVLSPSVANKVDIYNSSEVSEMYEERSQSLFHRVSGFFAVIVKVYFFILILNLRKILKLMPDKVGHLQEFFSFLLLLYSLTFIIALVPSGGRFITISNQLFLFLLLRFFIVFKSKKYKRLIIGLLPAFSFLILFQIVYLGYTLTSSSIWYGNLFWIVYEGIGYEFIKLD